MAKRFGAEASNWRGGRSVRKDGRVLVYAPGHPNANMGGGSHILEYRLVASQMLGRPLRRGEIVHHRNGDVTDNRPENLEVMTQSEHSSAHHYRVGTKRDRVSRIPTPESFVCDGCGERADRWTPRKRFCSQRCANVYWWRQHGEARNKYRAAVKAAKASNKQPGPRARKES